jgi:hypothetical protein
MQKPRHCQNGYNKTILKNEIEKERDIGERIFFSKLKNIFTSSKTFTIKSLTQNSVKALGL